LADDGAAKSPSTLSFAEDWLDEQPLWLHEAALDHHHIGARASGYPLPPLSSTRRAGPRPPFPDPFHIALTHIEIPPIRETDG